MSEGRQAATVCSTPEQLVCIAFEQDIRTYRALREKGVEFLRDGSVKTWPEGRLVRVRSEDFTIADAEDIGRALAHELPRFLEMYMSDIDPDAALSRLGLDWSDES